MVVLNRVRESQKRQLGVFTIRNVEICGLEGACL